MSDIVKCPKCGNRNDRTINATCVYCSTPLDGLTGPLVSPASRTALAQRYPWVARFAIVCRLFSALTILGVIAIIAVSASGAVPIWYAPIGIVAGVFWLFAFEAARDLMFLLLDLSARISAGSQ